MTDTQPKQSRRISFRFDSIRTQLILTISLLIVLVATAISISTSITTANNDQQQATRQLHVIANLTQSNVEAWQRELTSDIHSLTLQEVAISEMQDLLQATSQTLLRDALHQSFRNTLSLSDNLAELVLLDLDGRIVLSSAPDREESAVYVEELMLDEGAEELYFQPIFYAEALGEASFFIVQPILHQSGRTLGYLVGRANMDRLNEVAQEQADLANIYLVNNENLLVTEAHGNSPDTTPVHSPGIDASLSEHRMVHLFSSDAGQEAREDYRGAPIFGAYHWLPEMQAVMVVEKEQAEIFATLYTTMATNGIIAATAVIVAILVGLWITRNITNPLSELAQVASQIAAGNLSLEVDIERKDEIGDLAEAFRSMSSQLREMIGSLEQRVSERTRALNTSVEVSRNLSTILDLNELTHAVVEEIRSAFEYYYTQIYLFDESGQYLELQAATGEAGKEMLQKGHRLQKGQGLVGRAARSQEPVIIPDVSEAEDWLPNPLLPDTRSEAAVPILIGDQLLGVLDVQDDEVGGLTAENDAALLQSVANQVAVALQNARSYEQMRHQAERANLLNEIGQKIQRATTVESVLQVTAKALGQTLGPQRATIQIDPRRSNGEQQDN